VRGGFEEWAYAGGWDHEDSDATVKMCEPLTYPLYEDGIQISYEDQVNATVLTFVVETDNHKRPP
jgi:hypothetical protein